MKKILFVVCILGLVSFSSCKSSKKACDYTQKTEIQNNQLEIVAENN